MTALDRPPLPPVPQRLRWPGTIVAVFGSDAAPFALRMAETARARDVDARTIRVELRHREGYTTSGDRDLAIACAPGALTEALEAARGSAALTIGVGAAFAAAVESDLSVWIRAGETPLSLPERERALASEARLVLEEARPSTADALVDALVRAGSRAVTGL